MGTEDFIIREIMLPKDLVNFVKDDRTHGSTELALIAIDGIRKLVEQNECKNPGELEQLNEDHSMAPQIDLMVTNGLIGADQAREQQGRRFLPGREFDRKVGW